MKFEIYNLFNKAINKLIAVIIFHLIFGNFLYAADIPGFKSALFGSAEVAVIKSIQHDFGIKTADIVIQTDAISGMRILEIKMPKLEPMDESATLTYQMGFKCKCLVKVNIVWNIPDKNFKERRESAMAGMTSLIEHFKKKDWKESDVIMGRLAGELTEGSASNYIFFRGINDRNSSITLWGSPVIITKVQKPAKGDSDLSANVDTINQIVVSYELDYKTPDIRRFNTTGY